MSRVRDTLWPLEPHTAAKHEILRRYLEAWFPILGRWHPRLVFVDGFCGPGRYEGGEDGSPLVALEVVGSLVDAIRAEPEFVFIDERADRVAHLRSKLEEGGWDARFAIDTIHGRFADTFPGILDRIESAGPAMPPMFVFLDPFGFSGIPFELTARILRHPRTEAFVLLNTESLNRFIEHPNAGVQANMVEAFGTDRVLDIPKAPGHRILALRELFQERLRTQAAYVRYFEMADDSSSPIYHLFFAGNHRLGHVKMKEAMWRVNPSGAFRYSDATDPGQLVLFGRDVQGELLRLLLHQFAGRRAPVSVIQVWVEDHTAFLSKHMRAELKRGEKDGLLTVEDTKRDGSPRRAGTLPKGAMITFPDSPSVRV